MITKPGDTVTIDFTTQTAATGALTNADSLPTGTVSKNGTDDGTVTVTVSNKATGRYNASFTVPVAYVAGDEVDLYIAATVATIAGGGVVWRATIDTKRVSDLNDASAPLDSAATQAAAAAALTSYDPPTKAEMEARTLLAASYATATAVAAVKTDTGNLVTRIPAALFTGITSLAQWLGLIAGKQTGNSTARTEIRATGAGSGTFDETADSLEAVRDRGDAVWITATGFSTLDAAGVRTAVGLATANLDTQLTAMKGAAFDTSTDSLEAIRNRGDAAWITAIGFSTLDAAGVRTAVGLSSANLDTQLAALPTATENADAILSRDVDNVEASAGEHTLCTIILASLESSVSGTTWTIKRTDGSTTHATKTVTSSASADPITGVS